MRKNQKWKVTLSDIGYISGPPVRRVPLSWRPDAILRHQSGLPDNRETRTFVRLNIGVGAKRNSFENAKRTRNKRDFFTKKNCRKNPVYTLRKERRDAHHSFSLPVPVLKWTFWFQNESSRVQYSFVFADHFECAKLCGRQTKLKFEVSFIYTIFA